MTGLVQDIRLALRQLRRRPAFAAVVVITLGLGIGASAGVFSVLNAMALRRLPFTDESRLVRLYQVPHGDTSRISLPRETFVEVQRRARSFSNLLAQLFMDLSMDAGEGPERVVAIGVSEGWAATLGIQPTLGRTFTSEEYEAGPASSVVVLGHAAWQVRFGGDPGVVGRSIVIDGRARQVVGVMPRGFRYPYEAELWLPMNPAEPSAGPWSFNAQARLRPGVSVAEAQAELDAVAARLAAELPERHQGMGLLAVPTREVLVGERTGVVAALQGAVAFVLLIACANVASIFLARTVSRSRELAVRAALGGGRLTLARQVLVESLVLAAAGGIVGLGVLLAARAPLARLLPDRFATVTPDVVVDGNVLGVTVALILVTGVICGAVPAVFAGRRPAVAELRSGPRGAVGLHGGGALRWMVVVEIAMAAALVVGAWTLVRTYRSLITADLGFDAARVTAFHVSLDRAGYDGVAARVAFARDVSERLAGLPGVAAVGVTTTFPVGTSNTLALLQLEDREPRPDEQVVVNYRFVTPSFFESMGIPLVAGRGFDNGDDERGRSVAVVSRSMAARYWQPASAVGQRLRSARAPDGDWATVVGVVGDVREPRETRDTVYLPLTQSGDARAARELIFTLRKRSPEPPSQAELRRVVWAVDPTLPIFDVAGAAERYAGLLEEQRAGTAALGGFSLFGLGLAALGVYGVMTFALSSRVRELGVRVALGARPAQLFGLVLRQSALLATLGLSVGAVAAVAMARLLASAMSNVAPVGVGTYLGAAGILAAVVVGTGLVPARRAAAADPMQALRAE